MKRVLLLMVIMLAVVVGAYAQTHPVTGKVMDQSEQGFPGATISVKGLQLSTVSDINGDFMMEVPDGRNLFIISAPGFNAKEMTESDGTIIVTLQPIAQLLEGKVVTAQNFVKEKRNLGYSSSTIGYEELVGGNNTSVISALAGKVPGANITSSTGGAGGSSRIVARGEKSLLRNNNMLVVVDGIITNNYDRTQSQLANASSSFSELSQVDFGNSANDLSIEEIESVTFLSATEATVLYGAQGANGALMYTTKKGMLHTDANKRTKLDITYKMSYTQSDVLKFADMQNTYGQGNNYNGVADDRGETFSWGDRFNGSVRPWGQIIEGKQLAKQYTEQRNNIRNFYDHGRNLNNYVSFGGGTEKSNYMLSLNSLNSTGVVPNTFYNRYNVRFNGATQLSNNFYTSLNVNYINTYSRAETNGQGAGSVNNALSGIARDIPLWEMKDFGNKFYSMKYYDTSGAERYGASSRNPYWVAANYDNRNKSDRVLGDFKVGYKKGEFNVFNRFGVDVTSDRSFYNSPQFSASPVDAGYLGGATYTSAGGYTQSNYNGMRLYNDLIANFTHTLSKNFDISATLGHNVSIMRDETLAGIIDPANGGLIVPDYYNLQNNAGPVTGYNYRNDRRVFGLYADVDLNYKNELFFGLSGRNDWSSTIVRDRNSYYYPGANAAWVFTERLEGTSFKDKVLNYGKVRVAAGGTGNGGIPYANNNAGYVQSPIRSSFGSVNSPFNGLNVYQIQDIIGNPNLRPEQTRQLEVGFDFSFLKDRVSMAVNLYGSLTTNLIAPVAMPPSSGFTYYYVNVGDVSNKGQEIAFRATPIKTRYGLRWDLFGTYTHNVNKVEALVGGVDHVVIGGFDGMQIVAAKGKSYGTFYASDIQYVNYNGRASALVDPVTGLPVKSEMQYLGSFLPKFQASWGTDLSYKGLKLHALFVTKQGGQFYSRTKMAMDYNGTSEESTINNRNPTVWNNSVYQVANTNIYLPNTTKYLPYTYYTNTVQDMQAQGLVNASYVRLQELSLSYKVPQKYYKRSPFGGLEAGVYGNNLILWTAESNKYEDPEMTSAGAIGNGQGFNYMARPSLRNYGAFVKVTF